MSEGTLLLWLVISAVILPTAAVLEYLTPEHKPVTQVHHEEASYSSDLQSKLMEQLDQPAKLFHPRNAKERAEAIPDLWSLDVNKPLKLSMR